MTTFDEGYLKNRIEAIEAEKANHCLTRLGIVVTTEKQPIDSVTFFDYNNEIITCTDNVGFFKITRGIYSRYYLKKERLYYRYHSLL